MSVVQNPVKSLDEQGFLNLDTGIPLELSKHLKKTVFVEGLAGRRCLLDHPAVMEAARMVRQKLSVLGFLSSRSVAIQAIAFDKTSGVNWKVAWHQDLMFPFAKPAKSPGYLLPCLKDGVNFAQPPVQVLNELLAVRLHLDDCHAGNGPLRVSPGTHKSGIIKSESIARVIDAHGHSECLASEGEVLLMRPLLLHASSQAIEPNHRRVLHFVFHSGPPTVEPWAQAV